MSEIGEPGGLQPRRFELTVQRPELQGFDHVVATEYTTLRSGHKVPSKYDVIFPDGSVRREHDADEVMYVLMPHELPGIPPIVVTLDRAAHVKLLHIDGEDSGSVFNPGLDLETILMDAAAALPEAAVTGNYDREAFDIDMGVDYGWENLIADWEALEQGLISQQDYSLLHQYEDAILRKNLYGTLNEKRDFALEFNREFGLARVFLKVIRDQDGENGVVVPHMYGDAHPTSKVMMALSTRRPGPNRKLLRTVRHLHTITPGRAMGKHPIPGQHRVRGDHDRIDMKSFRTSAYNWTHHLLILPWPDDYQLT